MSVEQIQPQANYTPLPQQMRGMMEHVGSVVQYIRQNPREVVRSIVDSAPAVLAGAGARIGVKAGLLTASAGVMPHSIALGIAAGTAAVAGTAASTAVSESRRFNKYKQETNDAVRVYYNYHQSGIEETADTTTLSGKTRHFIKETFIGRDNESRAVVGVFDQRNRIADLSQKTDAELIEYYRKQIWMPGFRSENERIADLIRRDMNSIVTTRRLSGFEKNTPDSDKNNQVSRQLWHTLSGQLQTLEPHKDKNIGSFVRGVRTAENNKVGTAINRIILEKVKKIPVRMLAGFGLAHLGITLYEKFQGAFTEIKNTVFEPSNDGIIEIIARKSAQKASIVQEVFSETAQKNNIIPGIDLSRIVIQNEYLEPAQNADGIDNVQAPIRFINDTAHSTGETFYPPNAYTGYMNARLPTVFDKTSFEDKMLTVTISEGNSLTKEMDITGIFTKEEYSTPGSAKKFLDLTVEQFIGLGRITEEDAQALNQIVHENPEMTYLELYKVEGKGLMEGMNYVYTDEQFSFDTKATSPVEPQEIEQDKPPVIIKPKIKPQNIKPVNFQEAQPVVATEIIINEPVIGEPVKPLPHVEDYLDFENNKNISIVSNNSLLTIPEGTLNSWSLESAARTPAANEIVFTHNNMDGLLGIIHSGYYKGEIQFAEKWREFIEGSYEKDIHFGQAQIQEHINALLKEEPHITVQLGEKNVTMELTNIVVQNHDQVVKEEFPFYPGFEDTITFLFCGRAQGDALNIFTDLFENNEIPEHLADEMQIIQNPLSDHETIARAVGPLQDWLKQYNYGKYEQFRWMYDGFDQKSSAITAQIPDYYTYKRYLLTFKVVDD